MTRIVIAVLLGLSSGCSDEPSVPERDNPLDPDAAGQNPFELQASLQQDLVRLTWTDPAGTNLDGYHLYRGVDDSLNLTRFTILSHQTTAYVDEAVERGHDYYYTISAFRGTEQSQRYPTPAVRASLPPRIEIAGDSLYVVKRQVGLTLRAPRAKVVMLSEDATFTGAAWEEMRAHRVWRLSAGGGTKRVYARFRYANGSVQTDSDSAMTIPPTPGHLRIAAGEPYTASRSVLLAFEGTAADSMLISNDPEIGSGPWVPFSPLVPEWVLAPGPGTKWVYAWLRNGFGEQSARTSDSIDPVPMTDLRLSLTTAVGDSEYTGTEDVEVRVTGLGASRIKVANTLEKLADSQWAPYATHLNWVLPGADGVKSVFAQFGNEFGDSSDAIEDRIVLDRTSPDAVLNTDDDSTSVYLLSLESSSDRWTPREELLARWDIDGDGTWDTGWSNTKTRTHTCSSPGSFRIVAEVRDRAGNVASDDLLLVCMFGRPLHYGSLVSGSISTPTQKETYQFEAQVGDRVILRMNQVAGDLDPSVELLDVDGDRMIIASGSLRAEILDYVLPANGMYTVVVCDDGLNEVGSYALSLQSTNHPGGAQEVEYGGLVHGGLGSKAQMHAYRLTAQAGDRVVVRMSQLTGEIRPYLEMFRPDGIPVRRSQPGSGATEIVAELLSTGGTYTILASDDDGDDLGTFDLSIQSTSNPRGAEVISYGSTVSKDVTSEAGMDAYRFVAQAGDRVILRMNQASGSLDPSVELFGVDGSRLQQQTSTTHAEILDVVLSAGGSYTVIASDAGLDETGSYSLSLQSTNRPGGAEGLAYGDLVQGSLDVKTQMLSYQFTAQSRDRVLIRMSQLTGEMRPYLELFQPGGNPVKRATGSAVAEVVAELLPTTGTYTLLASDDNGNDLGSFNLSIQCTNHPGGVQAITYGDLVQGTLSNEVDLDAYRFDAEAGDRVLLRMNQASGTMDPSLELFGVDGSRLVQQVNSTRAEILDYSLPVAGTYTVIASESGSDETGSYALGLQSTNRPIGAESVEYGGMAQGTLDAKAQMKTYQFLAQAQDRVVIRMSQLAGEIWPYLELFQPDGSAVKRSTPGLVATEIVAEPLPVSGTYTLLASDDNGNELGSFLLALQSSNRPQGAGEIAYGDLMQQTIADEVDMDVYQFTAQAGDRVILRMNLVTGGVDPSVEMFGVDGSRLKVQTNSTRAEILDYLLPLGGTYTVIASDAGLDETGGYALSLQSTNLPGGAQVIEYGDLTQGDLTAETQMKAYRFAAQAQDRVVIRMSQLTGDVRPYLELFQPDGNPIKRSQPGSEATEIIAELLSVGGTYTLLASDDNGNELGSYHLSLQSSNRPGEVEVINYGSLAQGNLASEAEMDVYRFAAQAGDRVILRMNLTSGSLDPSLELYGFDGSRLEQELNSTRAEILDYLLPVAGTYTVIASDGGLDETGGYALSLQSTNRPGGAQELTYGNVVQGYLDTETRMLPYQFVAQPQDRVVVRMSRQTGDLRPYLELFGPDGSVLRRSQPGSQATEIVAELLSLGGLYTILASDDNGNELGSYNLSLQSSNRPSAALSLGCVPNLGTTTTETQMDVYQFDGSAGDRVLLRMNQVTGSVDPSIELFGTDGSLLKEATGTVRAEILDQSLVTSGTYVVIVRDNGLDETGGYALSFQTTNRPLCAVPLSCDAPTEGSINAETEMDPYEFTAQAGELLTVQMTRLGGLMSPNLELFGPDGARITVKSGSTQATITDQILPSDGAYLILASDNDGNDTGSYTLLRMCP